MQARGNCLKSLQELEQQDWGVPTQETYLVKRCHALRHLPLKELTTEDLRILIGQEIGLLFLVPLALEVLERDPLIEGDFYPGDLLKLVAEIPKGFWEVHNEMRHSLCKIVFKAIELLESRKDDEAELLLKALTISGKALQEQEAIIHS